MEYDLQFPNRSILISVCDDGFLHPSQLLPSFSPTAISGVEKDKFATSLGFIYLTVNKNLFSNYSASGTVLGLGIE